MNESQLFMKYRSSYKSAFSDLVIHFFYLLATFFFIYYFKDSYLSIFTIPLLGLLNLKTFIIFHDCGHHSYTPNKQLNYIIGTTISPLVYFPFSWSYRHTTHHLTNGNYENKYKFNFNELIFSTFDEYKKMSKTRRTIYKIIFSPYILFTFLTYIKFPS